ncbi:hypothetical protein [Aeromonas sp. AE23HZ002T15]
MDIEELISKYRGHQRAPSTLCCFTMLLEWVDTPESQDGLERIAGRFKTVRGAVRVLPEILQAPDLNAYMERNGIELLNHNFMQDGDLLVLDGTHSYLFYCGYLFGVTGGENEIFGFAPFIDVKIHEHKSAQAYRRKQK